MSLTQSSTPEVASRSHLEVAVHFLLLCKLYKQGARFTLALCAGRLPKSWHRLRGWHLRVLEYLEATKVTKDSDSFSHSVRSPALQMTLASSGIAALCDHETCRLTQVRAVVVTEDVLRHPDLVHLHYASS